MCVCMCSVCMSNCVAYSPLQDIEEHKIFARPYETQAPKVMVHLCICVTVIVLFRAGWLI